MNLSAIKYKHSSIAFDLFRKWVKNAHKLYPDLDFTINDEQVIVNDFSSTLKNALRALFEPKHKNDRSIPGWEYGFLLGFVEGNLGELWFHEYIKKRSNEYKQIMLLNAIKLYLKNDELANVYIMNLYKELIQKDTNLNKIDILHPNIKVDIKKFSVTSEPENFEHLETITGCLETLRTRKIMEFVKQEKPDIMPRLDRFLSEEELKTLISENE